VWVVTHPWLAIQLTGTVGATIVVSIIHRENGATQLRKHH